MPRKKSPVKDNPSLERDLESNAILNRDTAGYLKSKARRKAAKGQANRISVLEKQVADLMSLVRKLSNK